MIPHRARIYIKMKTVTQELCALLRFEKSYPYTAPQLLGHNLRHAVVQGEDDDGQIKVADAFFKRGQISSQYQHQDSLKQ